MCRCYPPLQMTGGPPLVVGRYRIVRLLSHGRLGDLYLANRLSSEMVRLGAPSDAIELIVVDAERRIVPRPGTN
jgi:hypothetical protein